VGAIRKRTPRIFFHELPGEPCGLLWPACGRERFDAQHRGFCAQSGPAERLFITSEELERRCRHPTRERGARPLE
jgi:hypothetical protein